MKKIKEEAQNFGIDKYLFMGMLILIFLTIFTFYDFAANESLAILYIIPLSGIFLLASLIYICFFAFDLVPLYRAKKYKEFVKKVSYYSFLWFFVSYTIWTIIVSDDSINNHTLQRVKDDLFIGKLINLLPDEIANNTKEMIFDKSKPQNRYIISLFFVNNLITVIILAGSSFIFGIHRKIGERPSWFQRWIEKFLLWKQQFFKWATYHKDKLVHGFIWLLAIASIWDTFTTIYSIQIVIIIILASLILFYVNMIALLDILTKRTLTTAAYMIFYVNILLFIFIAVFIRNTDNTQLSDKLHNTYLSIYALLIIGAFFGAFAERTNQINRDKVNEIIRKQQAEIQALTYQIDPHFLFNSLAFIYSKSQEYSADLAEAILLLSEMMRYKLSKTDNYSYVALTEEIEHLQNYIRFDELIHPNNHVVFKKYGSFDNLKIISNLLDIFVENALKYGDVTDESSPLDIQLTTNHNRMLFRVYNKKLARVVRSRPSTLTGLQNARNRLDMIYADRHQLFIQDESTSYTVLLTIDL
ncbi:sensor histidine kinase [Spirosoma sp. 209]|uniref:sensor histidine kinase n=1 Tax=Spirosoma sp. 209 TaxID=1955701 RepID=UPI001374803A|nr:sensor histidine kinase [Spirosoma sp. 209]